MFKILKIVTISTLLISQHVISSDLVSEESGLSIPKGQRSLSTQENKWWDDYRLSRKSKTFKGMTQYVNDLSKVDAEAASWFFLTGGKYGFDEREATKEEEKLLLEVAKRIGLTLNVIPQVEKWTKDNPLGLFHFDIICSFSSEISYLRKQLEIIKSEQENIKNLLEQSFENEKNFSNKEVNDTLGSTNTKPQASVISKREPEKTENVTEEAKTTEEVTPLPITVISKAQHQHQNDINKHGTILKARIFYAKQKHNENVKRILKENYSEKDKEMFIKLSEYELEEMISFYNEYDKKGLLS